MMRQHNQSRATVPNPTPATSHKEPSPPGEEPAAAASTLRGLRSVAFTVGGLLVLVIGALALAINENTRVKHLTEQALNFDVEVEDEGDDVRIAVLQLRHIHRNIALGGASSSSTGDFDAAFADLTEELGELEALDLDQHRLNQPQTIRQLASEYHDLFRPVIPMVHTDRPLFDDVSTRGLDLLEQMDSAAEELDAFGEQLADESLGRVNASLRTEQAILWGLMIGAAGVAAALTFAASRVLQQLRALYTRERDSQAALATALRTKTDFVADASHELRTPLAIIIGNAETSLRSQAPHRHRDALQAIAEEAHRMNHLVDDLLFLARSDAGAPPLEIEFVPARWLARRSATSAEQLATQRGACLTSRIQGEGYLEADPERIQQAVLILIDNAARHSPPDACVALTTRIGSGHYEVTVQDAGPGIGASELPHIFERFYQVKTGRTRSQAGSGLGLSIARSIALAHGGSLTAQSTAGAGTVMTLSLPLVEHGNDPATQGEDAHEDVAPPQAAPS
ncbi:MAG: HAMP domain-containing histidine kinase [Chloroflexota bacterium]|nr:HAMP domain-containing histidine kinase [Chloroflexota bacterium]